MSYHSVELVVGLVVGFVSSFPDMFHTFVSIMPLGFGLSLICLGFGHGMDLDSWAFSLMVDSLPQSQ